MPKSYLRDEPGAQRAERNQFDPYLQVYNRLQALQNIGHPTGKVELIILGGTWSYYPEKYQIWFVKRCFEALNDFGKADHRPEIQPDNIFEDADQKYDVHKADGRRKTYNELIAEIRKAEGDLINSGTKESAEWEELWLLHTINASSDTRCVGLVIETRPDDITVAETQRIRQLGCTKVQIGIQTLNDAVNDANKRGHHASHVASAFILLRAAGFKVHGHLMPNLYTATPVTDLADYTELFANPSYRPDELKIYPTSVIKNTELFDLWQQGKYEPYSQEVLVDLLAEMMVGTPPYCRLTRVIRDIPSTDIEAGNINTNLREVVEKKMRAQGRTSLDIRWREIRNRQVGMDDLKLDSYTYETSDTKEIFLSYVTKDDNSIAAFLRLSLPLNYDNPVFAELNGCAMIREIHVYGQMMNVGNKESGMAQHLGLGSKLIEEAKQLTKDANYEKLAVISAIGTREYYAKRGFELKQFYQICTLIS
jgi:elongator complex protein 3